MTDPRIVEAAKAILEDLRIQFGAPKGLHGQKEAWAAKCGEIDCEKLARAAILSFLKADPKEE